MRVGEVVEIDELGVEAMRGAVGEGDEVGLQADGGAAGQATSAVDRGDAAANLRADRNENDAVLCDGLHEFSEEGVTDFGCPAWRADSAGARASIVPSFT